MAKDLAHADAFRIENTEQKPQKATRLASRRHSAAQDESAAAKYQLNCLMSADLKKPLKRLCVEEDVTLGAVLEPLLRKHLRSKGYLKDC